MRSTCGAAVLASETTIIPLRHGYTNDIRGDGAVVAKRYEGIDKVERWTTERTMLTALAAYLPVPRVLDAPEGELRLQHVHGVQGQELIQAGYARQVLRGCGVMLRRIQEVNVGSTLPDSGGPGVLVHGDFGPNNLLFDPVIFVVTAVLDWERAHRGSVLEDLAWCEWIIRSHHPTELGALRELFAGYGARPMWADWPRAMLAKCKWMLERPRNPREANRGITRWAQNLEWTREWTEANEQVGEEGTEG